MIWRFCGIRRGFYIFSCFVMVMNMNYIIVGFMKNGYFILKVFLIYGVFENGLRIVVLIMNKGDLVWVRCFVYNFSIFIYYNFFFGYFYLIEIQIVNMFGNIWSFVYIIN